MSIIGDIKDIGELLKNAGNIELYRQLLDVQGKAMELLDQNRELREKNKELEEKLNTKEDVTFRNDAYWKKSNNDGPFCVPCWDNKGKLMRMVGDEGYFHCPQSKCTYVFRTEEYIKREKQNKHITDANAYVSNDKLRKVYGP